jgi:hypothetical protein
MLNISDVTPSMAFTLAETGGVATTFTEIVPSALVSIINPIQTVNVNIGEGGGLSADRITIFASLGIYVGTVEQISNITFITYSEWLNGSSGYWWSIEIPATEIVITISYVKYRPWYPANLAGFF